MVTARDAGSDDALDSDVDPIDGRSSTTGFLDGSGVDTDDLTLDLGIYVPATIGDLIWEDRNGDGVQQAGEPGVSGVTVDLVAPGDDGVIGTADDEIVDSVVSDDAGGYLFTGVVPGQYVVAVDLGTLPTGALIAPTRRGQRRHSRLRRGPGHGSHGADRSAVRRRRPDLGRRHLGTARPAAHQDRRWDAGSRLAGDVPVGRLQRRCRHRLWAARTGRRVADRLAVRLGHRHRVDLQRRRTDGHLPARRRSRRRWSSTLTLTVDVGTTTASSITNEATVTAIGSGNLDPTPLDNTASTGSITVTNPPAVPRTGNDSAAALRLAWLALGLGVLLWVVGRRRASV